MKEYEHERILLISAVLVKNALETFLLFKIFKDYRTGHKLKIHYKLHLYSKYELDRIINYR